MNLTQCPTCINHTASGCLDDTGCLYAALHRAEHAEMRARLLKDSRRKIIAQRDAAREQICELRKLVRTILARHEPEMLKIYDEAWENKHA